MDLCDNGCNNSDRADRVRDVLRLLTDVLSTMPAQQELTLSPNGISGLAVLLLACVSTLNPIK